MTTISHNHALLIGVGADLPNTVNDAKGLAEVLVDPARCAYDSANVVVLTEQKATRNAILSALDKLQQVATDATVVIYFSGHGYMAKSTLGKHYFLMPFGYDLTDLSESAISGKEFADKLAAIPAQRLLLLLDCCHAQGIGQSKIPGITLTEAPLPPEAEQLFAQGRGRIILTSSKAAEVSFAGTPYSLFTRALIECLCGADVTDGDGYVRALDLAMYASRQVTKWSQDRQHPMADTQHADNFVVAYYAAGAKSPLPPPFPALDLTATAADVNRQAAPLTPGAAGGDNINATNSQGFINRPSGPVQQHFGTRIDTGGAAYIGGNVNTSGGKVVGRDDFSVTTTHTSQGASLADFTALLTQIQQLLNATALGEEERAEVTATLVTIVTQTNMAQPKLPLITAKLKYIKALIETSASGGMAPTGLRPALEQAILLAGQGLR